MPTHTIRRNGRNKFPATKTVSPLLVVVVSACLLLDTSLALSMKRSMCVCTGNPTMTHTSLSSRRDWFRSVAAASLGTASSVNQLSVMPSFAEEDESSSPPSSTDSGVTVYTTSSGLKYIDLKPGTGNSPRYGQLCSIHYTGYIKLPNKRDKQKFDSSVFLIKHGNGRTIAGLDEGLHTMKVGGARRLIIPPKLGYVQSGLGPIPESPFARGKLGDLLDDMVAVRGGNVIFDVELRSILSDEADQGYYEDASLTPEDFETLKNNLQRKASDNLRKSSPSSENTV